MESEYKSDFEEEGMPTFNSKISPTGPQSESLVILNLEQPQSEEFLRSSSEGPMSEGPMSEGLMSEGPMSEGPMSEGPMSEGPMSEGPMSEGPMLEGPMSGGPNYYSESSSDSGSESSSDSGSESSSDSGSDTNYEIDIKEKQQESSELDKADSILKDVGNFRKKITKLNKKLPTMDDNAKEELRNGIIREYIKVLRLSKKMKTRKKYGRRINNFSKVFNDSLNILNGTKKRGPKRKSKKRVEKIESSDFSNLQTE
jgi:hypothetical protein